MPKYRMLHVPDAPFRSSWTIEQVTPGEKPVPIPLYGGRSEVEAELHRLNTGGKVTHQTTAPSRRTKRVRGKPSSS